jgi:hypothetical protein
MAGSNRSLKSVRTERLAEFLEALESCQPTLDEQAIPASPVLIEEQDGLSRLANPRLETRSLNLHQRNQAVDLRFIWKELSQDAAESERILAQRQTHPIVSGGGGVAFIEYQVDHLEYRR